MSKISFDRYLSHEEVNRYLEELVQKYANKIEIFSSAVSFEGRQIHTVRISPDVQRSKRPGTGLGCARLSILIDAGIHAREWITISVALYVIQQLVERDAVSARMLRNFDWIILPLLNPDGYEYSREHNKMWRKTRRPLGENRCVGVDCNRNFNVSWGIGTARFCSLLYRGERPFSELETRNVRDILRKLRPNCRFYLSLHSYAKAILYPRAYSRTLPYNWKHQHDVAQAGANAILSACGVKYRTGSAFSFLKLAVGGSSIDYAHDVEKVPYALVMEIASKGFHAPEPNITRICEETWIGIRAMVMQLAVSPVVSFTRSKTAI
ncbi:zinc carboxypeptidase [Culex quinquefasciatus]|uniref:Zinc carboxypeptidase n=1 Tax=Culex quinquefasciatus TaxID=7176 RepID=B0WTW1_CULQU|nr:zinc carboxypeptidase [Culex quinquefasciatus]|eukprot:XP_001856143.1 zinc carboxypeptidase [Culex quinquefasciatus]